MNHVKSAFQTPGIESNMIYGFSERDDWLLTKEEGKTLIADLHINVFGETIEERADRKRKLNALKESDPDAYLEIPAIERR